MQLPLIVRPLKVLDQQSRHGLEACGLSLIIPRTKQVGDGMYFILYHPSDN